MHLGIDFNTFHWILGSKLGGKMEPKVIQKGIEKMIKAAGGFGSVLMRFQEIGEWQEEEGDLSRGADCRSLKR